MDGCAAHPRSLPLHEPRRRFPKIQRRAGCRKLWIFKQLRVSDAVALQLTILLVLVRGGGGEHCPGSLDWRLQTDDRDEIRFYKA